MTFWEKQAGKEEEEQTERGKERRRNTNTVTASVNKQLCIDACFQSYECNLCACGMRSTTFQQL